MRGGKLERVRGNATTHLFESSAAQYPLRRRGDIPSVPLQVPHYSPPPNLREHLLYPVYICIPYSYAAPT